MTCTDTNRALARGVDDGIRFDKFSHPPSKQKVLHLLLGGCTLGDNAEIISSEDGYPSIDSKLQPLVEEIMLDYNNAKQAALAGEAGLSRYRIQSLVPHIMSTSETVCNSSFAINDVEKAVRDWEHYTPARPFEKIVHNFIVSTELQ